MALGLDDLAIGHWTDPVGMTGCTVIIPPPGNVTSVSVRGGGPGTRETDILSPASHVQGVAAVLLAGGSAFGLAAATGVVAWCEAKGIGYTRFGAPIPIVPGAVLFDLLLGDWHARPDAGAGWAACEAASTADGPMGNVGAGTGATVGKTAGPEHMTKGGLGWAVAAAGDLVVGAVTAVNAGGDILDADGSVIAGTDWPGGAPAAFRDRMAGLPVEPVPPGGNTTLALVAANAELTKGDVHRVAVQAHDGMARAISPVHTSFDGDTVFAVTVPRVPASPDLVAFLAEEALASAIRAGVRAAEPVPGVPAPPGSMQP